MGMYHDKLCTEPFEGVLDISWDSSDSATIFVNVSTDSADRFVHLEGCAVKTFDGETGEFLIAESFGFLADGCLFQDDNFVKRNFGKFLAVHFEAVPDCSGLKICVPVKFVSGSLRNFFRVR